MAGISIPDDFWQIGMPASTWRYTAGPGDIYTNKMNQLNLLQKMQEIQGKQAEAAQGTLNAVKGAVGAGGTVNLSLAGLGLPNLDVNQFRDIADPFWQQRAGYQTQLSNLISNPGAMTTSPMYQFALDQGLNAVNRTAAAQHMLGSGNRLADLTKFGQGLASQQFFPMASLLSNLAGVNAGSPGAALGGLVQARGQDIGAATDLYKTNVGADTAQKQIDAQLQLGANTDTLARDKFNYQVGQDTAAEAAAKKALSDYQWQQAYNNLYSGYSFG